MELNSDWFLSTHTPNRFHWLTATLFSQVRIGRAVGLALQDERMNTSHTPCMLRCARTMARPPRRHTPIVHLSQCLGRNTRTLRNLRQRLRSRAPLAEARRVRRCFRPHSLVRLPRSIRPRALPRHASSACCITLSLSVLSSRESPIVLTGPVHCSSALKTKWAIQVVRREVNFLRTSAGR